MQLLEWDSAHFGLRIARADLDDLRHWSAPPAVDCVYFLAQPDAESMRLAHQAGFRFVDERVTLAADPGAAINNDAAIRPAAPADLPELRRIAGESHQD